MVSMGLGLNVLLQFQGLLTKVPPTVSIQRKTELSVQSSIEATDWFLSVYICPHD